MCTEKCFLCGIDAEIKRFELLTSPELQWQPDAISLEESVLWRFNVAANNKKHYGLHVKCPIFLSDLKKNQGFLERFS